MAFGFGVGVQRLGSFGVATLSALTAITPGSSLRPTGFVYADPTPANNGVYTWSGSAWARQRGLPDGLASFGSVGGTANAITATAASGVDPATVKAAIIIPASNNTGAATLNGEEINDRSGSPLVEDALVAGTAALLFRDGSAWRLMTGNVAEISDVSGLQAALDAKASTSALTSGLAGKANTTHSHAISDVTGLQTALDALPTAVQINAATDEAFADTAKLVARKADGSLISRSFANVKAAIWTAWGALIAGGTAKTTPVDGDQIAMADSAASDATKRLSLINLWTNYLKGKTDALYVPQTGSWTPAFSATGATFSHAIQVGRYVKIGKLVHFVCQIQLNTSGNTLTANALSITGMPFTGPGNEKFAVSWFAATGTLVNVQASWSGSVFQMLGATAAATANTAPLNSNALLHATNGSSILFSGTYEASS